MVGSMFMYLFLLSRSATAKGASILGHATGVLSPSLQQTVEFLSSKMSRHFKDPLTPMERLEGFC